MKNHEARPAGSTPLPEVNAVRTNDPRRDRFRNHPSRGRGRGHKYGHSHSRDKFGPYNRSYRNKAKNIDAHQKWAKNNDKEKLVSKTHEDICYRCGMKGHWTRTCRTTKHLVALYQAFVDKKGKNVEVNFTSQTLTHGESDDANLDDVNFDATHLDVADFFEHPEERIDHLIGNGHVHKN